MVKSVRLTSAPDEGLSYGHARFEALAAFAIAGFLFVTYYQIILSALKLIFAHDSLLPEIAAHKPQST
jgi:divalent metal cation (Fe/Co/Zn/Cd) transporter